MGSRVIDYWHLIHTLQERMKCVHMRCMVGVAIYSHGQIVGRYITDLLNIPCKEEWCILTIGLLYVDG